SGDDAYEHYLKHYATHHQTDTPLTRQAFFKQWQDEKWNGIKRCC
ncbi:MAG: YbdD/YjiX family protein, partial [Methylococcaceae bacterium]